MVNIIHKVDRVVTDKDISTNTKPQLEPPCRHNSEDNPEENPEEEVKDSEDDKDDHDGIHGVHIYYHTVNHDRSGTGDYKHK